MRNNLIAFASAAVAAVCLSTAAQAHTTSLGYTPGSTEGSVIIWSGHYSHGGFPPLEGTAYLDGVSLVYSSSADYSIGPVSVKPAQLVDGVNNFFWGPSPYPFPVNVDPELFGGVTHWQGVEFSGLLPGTYDFSCRDTCGESQEWASLTEVGGAAGTVRFVLKGGDINLPGVPEPSTWAMMLVSFGAMGALMRHRRAATQPVHS